MKKCPYCAEEIQDDAVKCRFCGSDLVKGKVESGLERKDQVARTPNKVLMARARESLKGEWGNAIGAIAAYFVISFVVGIIPVIGVVAGLLIAGALELGLAVFFLALSREQKAHISQIFDGFRKFGVTLGAFLLTMIFTFLWSLLLIVPGIIAGYSYAMTFYIIADDDSIGPLEAITKSKQMMRGNKWKLFCLGWRFLGWALLCVLTLGIGFLWLGPYVWVSTTKFYDDLLKK